MTDKRKTRLGVDLQLATPEINAVRQVLQDYDPAQEALDTLESFFI